MNINRNRKSSGRFNFSDHQRLTKEQRAAKREAENALWDRIREEQKARHAAFDAALQATLQGKVS
jgi:hypothetical protein